MALVHPTPVDERGSAGAHELFGLALVEAMARGCPVIAADAASLPEIVTPEVDGLLDTSALWQIYGLRGFRLFRRPVLEEVTRAPVSSQGYCFQVDLAFRVHRGGFAVREVPITFTERTAGASKMSGAVVREALWRITAWAVRDRLRSHEASRTHETPPSSRDDGVGAGG